MGRSCPERWAFVAVLMAATVVLSPGRRALRRGALEHLRPPARCLVTVQALRRYPVKSCLGEQLQRAELGPSGILGDRTFAVSRMGRLLTQRQCPALAAVTASLTDGTLRLTTPGAPPLELPRGHNEGGAEVASSVFGADVLGIDQGDEAADWVSAAVKADGCRLLQRAASCPRTAVGSHWADLAPLLVVSDASMDALCRSAGRVVPLNRFRPNIVVSGADEPHAEDTWRGITIGDVRLLPVGPCGRCTIVDVDQAQAVRDRGFSVFGALVGHRGRAVFGHYYRPVPLGGRAEAEAFGAVDVGMEVEIA